MRGTWVTAVLLGAFHGLNPAMGWLFAVALGLQERRRRAVLAALGPIALGHALAVGAVALVLGLGRLAVPPKEMRTGATLLLIGAGAVRLARPFAHPRWVGMRVGFGDLVLWSFLMASAHGAGLMLAPVLLQVPGGRHAPPGAGLPAGAAVVGLHTASMFLVMGAVALLVYGALGLRLLGRAWLNLDLLWSVALVAAGVVTLLLPLPG